ncbi:type II toxin-antitoxin system HipA family toxin [Acidisoma cellulosilytica]|uniref:Type II toxin-antitoxin system HipA family toxin n=1 Tax=Acidisoma cellulosilyticum TaxID=2802395 RepID=A0A963Z4L2_9PROT|nr:type II toxin-antitoxin system HipA family toxin [Acidisoma cellulosilyticum]MCB8882658.1 type II toxin-antitoxin system HipA family toxin [Acidisoma cellulosilyticum]
MWQISKDGRIDRLVVYAHLAEGPAPVGLLTFERGGQKRLSWFRYAKSWLSRNDRFALDPAILTLKSSAFNGLPHEVPLPFYDSAPDGWGKSIIAAAFPSQTFGMGEFLAAAGDERTGELSFGPTPGSGPLRWLPDGQPLLTLPSGDDTLPELFKAAEAVEAGRATTHHLQRLFRNSADQGGARPKANLLHDGVLHMVKFPAAGDRFDDPKVEATCLSLAAAAGIETPAHVTQQIGNRTMLLVRRFDRGGNGERRGYASASTLLQADPTQFYAQFTYMDLARRAQLAGVQPCWLDLFRRMLFNCFIHNTDDHLRNHGFIRDHGKWRLSPIFDLSVHQPQRLVLAPAKGISPEANPAIALQAHRHFGISRIDAELIYDELVAAMAVLPKILDNYEVTKRDRETLAAMWVHALNPPTLARAGDS